MEKVGDNSIEFKPSIELVAIDRTVFHPLGASLPSSLLSSRARSSSRRSRGFCRGEKKSGGYFAVSVENPKRITHAPERLAGVAKKNNRQKVCFIHDLRTARES